MTGAKSVEVGKPRVLLLALDTYSRIGGLQNFNRRLIANLQALRKAGDLASIRACIMRDRPEDLVDGLADWVSCFGPDRLDFVRAAIAEACRSDVLLIGQLNLLPVGWLCKRFNPRLKLVLFVHGIEVWNAPEYRRKRFYEPALLKSYDVIASVSRYTAETMTREFGVAAEKFTIFPNAIDGPVTPSSEPAKPWLLTVTRLAPHDRNKHVDQVLHAFAAIASDHQEARLVVVGDGALRSELEALAGSLGIADRTDFLGRVDDARLQDLYGKAAAFVLPSAKEGFGIVYLEAWKHGLPVICSDRGAPKEIVDDDVDGFVVQHGDTAALADRMGRLLSDPVSSARMGRAGAEKVVSRYLNDHFKRNLSALITGRRA